MYEKMLWSHGNVKKIAKLHLIEENPFDVHVTQCISMDYDKSYEINATRHNSVFPYGPWWRGLCGLWSRAGGLSTRLTLKMDVFIDRLRDDVFM